MSFRQNFSLSKSFLWGARLFAPASAQFFRSRPCRSDSVGCRAPHRVTNTFTLPISLRHIHTCYIYSRPFTSLAPIIACFRRHLFHQICSFSLSMWLLYEGCSGTAKPRNPAYLLATMHTFPLTIGCTRSSFCHRHIRCFFC
ncbi:hypothetical protein P691DRAFT_592652 [Macrolepiota fuliginosa MF-IS2]|uniref:Uncharacterized protein n=1 Tax=Macrolepiota fuliginosa MF-IS2 TaxID=1400762 RepID=A0A9P6BWZ7_9AGAR|nr:hypothetical protein P691DRAFT_592652 [Macrolepiota fuliginosa MF-IS2]